MAPISTTAPETPTAPTPTLTPATAPAACTHPLCERERTFKADPTSTLGWHSRPNVDRLPMLGTFTPDRHGRQRERPIPATWPRQFCSEACQFAWIDAQRTALAAAEAKAKAKRAA